MGEHAILVAFEQLREAVMPGRGGFGGYETVAASTGPQTLGGSGAVGDYISHVVLIPSGLSPGPVTLTDGDGTPMTIFAGGSESLSNYISFAIALGMNSRNGAWKLTTGGSITAICVGKFS